MQLNQILEGRWNKGRNSKFIININSDSETESGHDESESDGDEIEEYEWL